ncbi:hypothetical protein GOBAR_DD23234 [Gossypium barbadense]|nr:hypothetical protein GOBAR_DD23234 [Gossypium barbadense]
MSHVNHPREDKDVDLIGELLAPTDVRSILRILIVVSKPPDKWIWRFEKNGTYTVKPGYRVAVEMFTNIANLTMVGCWLLVWNIELPPKVKDFWCRVLRNFIPCKVVLAARGGEIETIDHALPHCFKAREVRNYLSVTDDNISIASFTEDCSERRHGTVSHRLLACCGVCGSVTTLS